VAAVVLAAYFVRIGDVSMRGEEPRRAQVAFEMIERGDWVVPREQGSPFLSRPPLQNWLIAASTTVCGSRAPWAARLPSVLAMLLTCLLIYGYARIGLSRGGALCAALAFATCAEMFTTGCQAETEMVFIALVGAALLLWHWGDLRGWPALLTWCVAYVLVGLGVLCKGPQPPIYFLMAVSAYLLANRRWRHLLSPAHAIGALVGVAVVLAWVVPCLLRTSGPDVWRMLMNDSQDRFHQWKLGDVLVHLVQYPVEVFGSLLPWSVILFSFLSRDLRRSLGPARSQVLFATCSVATAFPTCWIPPGGATRYFAPLYPCLAVLVGVAVEQGARADAAAWVRLAWNKLLSLFGGIMIACGAAVVLAALLLPGRSRWGEWAEPMPLALGYAAAVLGLAGLAWRARHSERGRIRTAGLALAVFMVLTFTGMVTDARIRRSEDQQEAVARIKELLPPGQRLISIGPIDALFAYHFGDSIDPSPLTTAEWARLLARDELYFCFDEVAGWRPFVPFAWQPLGIVSMDRNRHNPPERAVVVGRRVRSFRAATVRERAGESAPTAP
jgi:4-amino-4-deoxy-L-arabinose transferase-like glycosyltransferase